MSDPNRIQAEQDTIEAAIRVVRTMDNLSQNEDFVAFMKYHSATCDEIADQILHDDKLEPEQREKMRNHRIGMLEILLSVKKERDAQARVLKRFGISE